MLNSTIARITHPACEISVVELPWEQYIANGLEYHHTILVVKGIYLPFSVQDHHDPVGVSGRHHYALCKSPLTYASTNSMNIRVYFEANAMGDSCVSDSASDLELFVDLPRRPRLSFRHEKMAVQSVALTSKLPSTRLKQTYSSDPSRNRLSVHPSRHQAFPHPNQG